MSRNYQENAEAVLDAVENQIKVSKRLVERGQITKEEMVERLETLLKDLERAKFYLSL